MSGSPRDAAAAEHSVKLETSDLVVAVAAGGASLHAPLYMTLYVWPGSVALATGSKKSRTPSSIVRLEEDVDTLPWRVWDVRSVRSMVA